MYRRPFQNNRRSNFSRNDYGYKKEDSKLHDHSICVCSHDHSIKKEFLCHIPAAISILSVSIILVLFLDSIISLLTNNKNLLIYHDLFHIMHYMHVMCASFVGYISYLIFNQNRYFIGGLISFFSSMIFCTISDIVMPSIGSFFLANKISIHLCFLSLNDSINVSIFALLGIICAYSLLKGEYNKIAETVKLSHRGHIFFGCMAGLFYILFNNNILWMQMSGIIMIILFLSIVLPCTISDIIIPKIFYKKN